MPPHILQGFAPNSADPGAGHPERLVHVGKAPGVPAQHLIEQLDAQLFLEVRGKADPHEVAVFHRVQHRIEGAPGASWYSRSIRARYPFVAFIRSVAKMGQAEESTSFW